MDLQLGSLIPIILLYSEAIRKYSGNRKRYFSVNGQFICSTNLKVLSTGARWAGNCHNSICNNF